MAKATPQKWKGGIKYCCVVGCYNKTDRNKARDPPVKLYRFPGRWYDKERREAWIAAVRRINPDGTLWVPKEYTRICSTHFVGNCKSDVRGHPSYIPTIFPPVYRKKAPDRQMTQSTNKSHLLVQACGAAEESHCAPKEDAICQTEECVTPGKLSIFLSVTNGAGASTQVVHTEMSHKVTSTDGNWKRNCGFRGFESLKVKEEALQDLCGVTL
ncbi:THAP domain-containing protein 5 [Rhipicephalus sanguineus]|uniref:THAP domain-containing protein 5 n=1 Tax=Rhipicephalus sanguineus TaxID=34632 RepID=UPI0018939B86|nr:THAP domain-containing protein 5 [Rhipicephalus sanguineus]